MLPYKILAIEGYLDGKKMARFFFFSSPPSFPRL